MNRIITFIILFLGITISTKAQDLYSIHSVKDVKITFAEDNWNHILDSLKYAGDKNRLLGSVNINGIEYDSVGVRYKGNSSYFSVKRTKSQKLPFNIKLNYRKKDQKLKGNYSTLKLSNVFRDPSFVREALAYEIIRKYMPASESNFVRLYVNNELIGLYSSVESVNEKFVAKHFGENEGLLMKCDPDNLGKAKKLPEGVKGCKIGDYANLSYVGDSPECYERLYEMKSDSGWQELIQLTKILKDKPEDISKYLNVDQTLWMHALNNVLVNLDSYSGRLCHNYYMYLDTSGIFHPIIWDLNLAFGGFTFADAKVSFKKEDMQKMTPFLHYKNEERPLISKLLSNPLYRKIYLAHIQTILRENFSNGEYLKRITSMQQTIDFYVKNDENKLYAYDAFKLNATQTAPTGEKSTMVGIKELMEARTAHLKAHPVLQKTQPTISTPNYTTVGDTLHFKTKVEGANAIYFAYRAGEHGVFKVEKMFDDGAHEDNAAADGFYGISFPKKEVKHYYIIAEAEKTAQLSPERASWEFHTVR